MFYAAVAEESIVDFIYGSAVDLFTCMLIFAGDAQYVEFAFKASLAAVAAVVLPVYLYKKFKAPKEVQG